MTTQLTTQMTMPTKQLSLPITSRQPNIDHTVMRSGIRFYTQSCFRIPAPIVESYFSQYQLLYWSAKHVYHNIIEGCILRNGIRYAVIYRGMTRGQLLGMIQNDYGYMQLPLSFRAPNSEWDIPPTVIIGNCETL